MAALHKSTATCPKPKDRANDGLVFITQQGNPWVRLQGNGWNDAVTIMCRELLKKLGLKRPGRNFYALRHTFRTIADETLDQPAINLIMGHIIRIPSRGEAPAWRGKGYEGCGGKRCAGAA